MTAEGLERVVGVCSRGRDKGAHAEASLFVLEERTRVEGIAAAAAVAVVAP